MTYPTRQEPPALLIQAEVPIGELLSASDDIKRMGITHTNRIPTGEYGEWLACKVLDLAPAESKVSVGGDSFDTQGRGYEVKTRIMKEADRSPSITGKNAGDFDFLVAVSLGPSYQFQRMWIADRDTLDWNDGQFRFGPMQISQSRSVSRSELTGEKLELVEAADATMSGYQDCLKQLLSLGVVRSEKTLAADLGEFFASCYFEIELADNVNQPGYDAVDTNGRRYQIKTRLPTPAGPAGTFQDCFTTYTSFDFKRKVLETKEFDILIACFLDSDLKPIGFLTAPYESVVGQILDRARGSGRSPSPRFRWNWKRFQERPDPGARVLLTSKYSHHASTSTRSMPIEVLPC